MCNHKCIHQKIYKLSIHIQDIGKEQIKSKLHKMTVMKDQK